MTYVKFNTLDDSASRSELIEELLERDYEDVPIIGNTDKNYLVEGLAILNGDNELVFHHEKGEDFGSIVEWAFAENPDVVTDYGREYEASQN